MVAPWEGWSREFPEKGVEGVGIGLVENRREMEKKEVRGKGG